MSGSSLDGIIEAGILLVDVIVITVFSFHHCTIHGCIFFLDKSVEEENDLDSSCIVSRTVNEAYYNQVCIKLVGIYL